MAADLFDLLARYDARIRRCTCGAWVFGDQRCTTFDALDGAAHSGGRGKIRSEKGAPARREPNGCQPLTRGNRGGLYEPRV